MSEKTIITDLAERVLVITLNRPERLNAWNYELHSALNRTIRAANNNSEIDAIVLTGGGKAFCAGADMADIFSASEEQRLKGRAESQLAEWVDLLRRSKPIVAAINGAAVGIGVTLVLPADQIFASDTAKFSLSFIKVGIVPEMASSSFIERRVGFGNASRLLLTGDTLTAQEALDISLIDRVVPAEALLKNAVDLARRMGANPHAALRETKQLLTINAIEADLQKVQQREMAALQRCYESPEHKEAVAAFLAKRKPDFKSVRG